MKNKEALQNRLQSDVDQYESMLEDELARKQVLLRKLAIAAGLLATGFAITKVIIGSEEQSKKAIDKPKGSEFGKLVLGIATPLLINFVKNKLANRS